MTVEESRASRLTAPGVGALHVVQILGPAVGPFLEGHFSPLRSPRGREDLAYGHLVDGEERLDEVLVHRHLRGAGADLAIHGGRAVELKVRKLVEASGFLWSGERGRDEALPPTHGAPAVEREALEGLSRTWAVQSCLFFLSALEGPLVRELESLAAILGETASGGAPRAVGAEARLVTLLDRAPFGLAMAQAPTVAITGGVNVGKSTLFNALLGEGRAVTSPEAGTTRDAVEARAEIVWYPFHLLDLAGERETDDEIEAEGIVRARLRSGAAAIRLRVLDARSALEAVPTLPDEGEILVFNKIDLLGAAELARLEALEVGGVAVSARTGEGLDLLAARIVWHSAFRGPAVRELPAPFTERQVALLREALGLLPHEERRAAEALEKVLRGGEAGGE